MQSCGPRHHGNARKGRRRSRSEAQLACIAAGQGRSRQRLTRFIEGRLKLQVNAQKSAVTRPWQRSFLGFTVMDGPQPRRRIADKAVAWLGDRVRDLTRRHRGISLERMIADLNPLLRGWAGYFGFSQLHELSSLDGWTRRRLRCVVWVQWKTLPETSSPQGA